MKHLKGAPLYRRPLALPTSIRLGWKSLPGTNTLAYYENPYITAVKSFIVQALVRKDLPETNTLAYYPKVVNYGCKKFYNIDTRSQQIIPSEEQSEF